jgi:hypothetical protein
MSVLQLARRHLEELERGRSTEHPLRERSMEHPPKGGTNGTLGTPGTVGTVGTSGTNGTPEQRAGVRRFVDGGWHDKAIALGWPEKALYGEGQGAQVLGNDRVLFVTADLIMACDRKGTARPIYRGVVY